MSTQSDFEKLFGITAADDLVRYWIDTGYPPLNLIISGDPEKGIPGGRIIEIHGESSSGKTWLTCQLMKAVQHQGGIAIFGDQERSLDTALCEMDGMSLAFPQWMYFRKETWEEYCDTALGMCQRIRKDKLITDDKPIMVVFDSVASMVPQSMLYDSKGNRREIKNLNMNDTTALPRAASSTMKILNSEFERLNVTFVLINQVREKPGVTHGDPRYTPGGKAFEFYPSVRLSMGRTMIKDKSTGETTGQEIGIKTKKNKCARPGQEVEALLVFPPEGGAVFDRETGLLRELINLKVLPWTGQMVEWVDGKKYYVKTLSQKLRDEGAFEELRKLYVNAIKGVPAQPVPEAA